MDLRNFQELEAMQGNQQTQRMDRLFQRVQQMSSIAQQHRAFLQRQDAKLKASLDQDARDAIRLPLKDVQRIPAEM